MSKKKSGWVKYSAEELKAQYEKEFAAGKTRLTESEWVAVFMMNESERLNKAAPVDKKPVGKSSKEKPAKVAKSGGRTVTVMTDEPTSRAKKTVKKEPAAASTPAPALIGGQPAPAFAQKKMEEAAQQPLPPNPRNDTTVLASGLTAKVELFCREYIANKFNGKKAAIAAGYSEKTAEQQASRLLSNVKVTDFIHKLTVPRLAKLEITADRIMQEYASLAFVNLGHFMARKEDGSLHTIDGMPSLDFVGVTDEMLAGLAGFETIILPAMGEDEPNPLKIKVKLGDKKGALDVLAKRAGLLKEEVNVTGEVKVAGMDDLKALAMKMAFMLRKAAAHDKKDG